MRNGDIKKRVLNVAYDKFLRQGFLKVSMDSIVSELKTSKSSLYNHFSSKEDLVKAVIDKLNYEIDTKLDEILGDDNKKFQEKLSDVTVYTKALLFKVNEEFLKDLELGTPDLWAYYQSKRAERIKNSYKKLFEIGVEEGVIRNDLNLDIILLAYLNLMVIPLRTEYINQLHVNSETIYEEVQEIFLNGVLSK
ncbi:MAG: TetR/AcrR family transcriptional regulator [Bacteroidota bacterium]